MTEQQIRLIQYLRQLDMCDKWLEEELEKGSMEYLRPRQRSMYQKILNCHYELHKIKSIVQVLTGAKVYNLKEDNLPEPYVPTDIILAVSTASNIDSWKITLDSRKRELVDARCVAALLMKKYLKISLPAIAKALERRDHTTIIHLLKKGKKLLDAGDLAFTELYLQAEYQLEKIGKKL